MKRAVIISIFFMVVITSIIFVLISPRQEASEFTPSITGSGGSLEGFRRADGSKILVYPADFGPHPDYQTEWWYYTGNLVTTDEHHFGYQLTFFRRGLLPPQEWTDRDSSWGTNQVYMGHFALSDIASNQHHAFEQFARGSAGLAGAGLGPFQVWLEDWQVIQTGVDEYRITASEGDILLDLTLTDTRELIPHGEHGYSQKGPETGNASYYFSQTRLDSSGTIQVENTRYEVKGLSWMDHEFSTNPLSKGQIGWDWFSIQLNDGSDLMVYQIRREDGSIDPFSSGTWVDPSGNTLNLNQADFEIQVVDTWRSPSSGAQYPSGWILQVPELKLSLEIQPMMADQEMETSYTYWEGAVDVSGAVDGEGVSGFGYVELTGYAASMEGEF